jgi:hypothetical protein
VWVMSDPLHLFTYDEYRVLTEEERQQWLQRRLRDVEQARREHDARQRLNDSLLVERFGHEHG